MTTTPVRPRRPIPQPVRITLPTRWREVFTDPVVVEAFDRYERLNAERGVAHQARLAAEQALEVAGVEDRDAMAKAIFDGEKPPTSDANAKKAAADLAEAARRRDAVFQAHAVASRDAVRVLEERQAELVANLNERIAAKVAEATAALAQLDSEVTELSSLRLSRFFVTDRAHPYHDPRYGPWQQKLVPEIKSLIEPAPSSETVEVTGDLADKDDS